MFGLINPVSQALQIATNCAIPKTSNCIKLYSCLKTRLHKLNNGMMRLILHTPTYCQCSQAKVYQMHICSQTKLCSVTHYDKRKQTPKEAMEVSVGRCQEGLIRFGHGNDWENSSSKWGFALYGMLSGSKVILSLSVLIIFT